MITMNPREHEAINFIRNHLRGRNHVIVILRRGLFGVTHEGDHARGGQPKRETKVNVMLSMHVGYEVCHRTQVILFPLLPSTAEPSPI